MGYNGSNRRFRSSVIKKSSVKFGTSLVSNVLVGAVGLATSAAKDALKTMDSSGAGCSFQLDSMDSISHEVERISIHTSKKYDYIEKEYQERISINKQVDAEIINVEKKIGKLNLVVKLLGVAPFLRKKVVARVSAYELEVDSLIASKKNTDIDIANIAPPFEGKPIVVASSSQVYFLFSQVFDYQFADGMYMGGGVNNQKGFFEFNVASILSLNFHSFQLDFFDSLFVLSTAQRFLIIDYEKLQVKFQQVYVIEKQIDNNVHYEYVKESWLHTCLDGTPDLRYRDNPRIYIVTYWALSIRLCNSCDIGILFTEKSTAQDLYQLMTSFEQKAKC